jgi:hypothetical protein
MDGISKKKIGAIDDEDYPDGCPYDLDRHQHSK